MTTTQRLPMLSATALEYWRASGARTRERLSALVVSFGETYYGSSAKWAEAIREEVATADAAAQAAVRAWEVVS